jgi:hypothetical protein
VRCTGYRAGEDHRADADEGEDAARRGRHQQVLWPVSALIGEPGLVVRLRSCRQTHDSSCAVAFRGGLAPSQPRGLLYVASYDRLQWVLAR